MTPEEAERTLKSIEDRSIEQVIMLQRLYKLGVGIAVVIFLGVLFALGMK